MTQKCKPLIYLKNNCYAPLLVENLKKDTFQNTYKILQEIQVIDKQMLYCHLAAHKLAKAQVDRDPKHWYLFLKGVDLQLCQQGFLHGAIEAYLTYDSNFNLNYKNMYDFCTILRPFNENDEQSKLKFSFCIHEMGHIALVQEQGNIKKAIPVCLQFKDNLIQYYCASGIFMESFNPESLVFHGFANSLPTTNENLARFKSICLKHTQTVAIACWVNLGKLLGAISEGNPYFIKQRCSSAPSDTLRFHCYVSGAGYIGNYINTGRFKSENLTKLCFPFIGKKDYTTCLSDIVFLVVTTNPSISNFLPFCVSQQSRYKKDCFQAIVKNIKTYNSSKIYKNVCSQFPGEYQYLCS